jgi:endonuclease/exonuclease/phosphatase family metal-dependent hydrolase
MHLRILTYNIHRAIGLDRRFVPERIVEIIQHHVPHIALLQEVDHGVPRSNHLDLATWIADRLEFEHRAVGLNVYLKVGRYGNATLSRWPIGRQRNIDLSFPPLRRRGAQHTTVHVPGTNGLTLDIFNVHLGLSALERRYQMRRLLAAREIREARPEHACIIAGDTNDWRSLLNGRVFNGTNFVCATGMNPLRPRGMLRTFPSFAPVGGLDKVFYRGPIELRSVHTSRLKLARVASDHLPVIAEFELKGGPIDPPGLGADA